MLERLQRVAEWAGNFPSALFGCAYLLAIPAFALAYSSLPFDFFHATARYEPLVIEQAHSIAQRIQRDFVASSTAEGRIRPSLNGEPIPVSPDGVFPIFSVEPEPDRIRITAHFLIAGLKGFTETFLKVALDLNEASILRPEDDEAVKREPNAWFSTALQFVTVRATVLSGPTIDLPRLFPCKMGQTDDETCLRMTLEDFSSLLSLRGAAAGRPTPLQGSYLRMLYFSAVTISTLGYGDIVPVTNRARGLVTVQIVLGPLLFGLFLNSLFRENLSKNQSTSARSLANKRLHPTADDVLNGRG